MLPIIVTTLVFEPDITASCQQQPPKFECTYIYERAGYSHLQTLAYTSYMAGKLIKKRKGERGGESMDLRKGEKGGESIGF